MNFFSVKATYSYLLLVLLFVLANCQPAQQIEKPVASAVVATTSSTLANSLLWKIEHPDLKAPSYLFGTVHAIPTQRFVLKDKVRKAIHNADVIAFEVDMDDLTTQVAMLKNAAMPDGQSLKNLLTEAEYKLLDSILLATSGLPIQMVNTLQPMMIGGMLISYVVDEPISMYETEIMQIAKSTDKDILGLETPEDAMKAITSIPIEDQVDDLRSMFIKDSIVIMRKEYFDLINSYKTENLNEIYANMLNQLHGSMNEALLLNRNKAWLPVIESYIKRQSTFFGVGVGHLAGDNGIINMLKSKGYTLSAIH